MKRFIAFLLAMWPALALADATVPSLAPATSLFGASTYLAQTGAQNNQLGFLTSTFCLNSGALTICPSAISGSMLGPGAALSNIGAGSISSSYLAPTGVTPGSYTNLNATIGADGRVTAASNGSGGGGGSLTLTDGTHTVASTTQITVTGGAVGGSTPNATLTITGASGVTSVATAAPVSGGPITGTGTISLAGPSNLTTFAAGSLPLGNGTSPFAALAAINGDCVVGSGGVWTAGACGAGGGITALTGDVTASGSGSVAATLATVNSNIGTFASETVNGKGLVTAAGNLTGDVTTSGAAATLATVNANVGSFTSANITVNGKGLITAAANGSGGGNMTGSGAATTGDVVCGNNTGTPLNTAVDCGFAPSAVDDPTTTGIFTAAQWNNGDTLVVTTASQTVTAPASSTLARNGYVLVNSIAASTLAANAADTITYSNGSATVTTSTGGTLALGAGALVQVTSKVAGNLKVVGNITGGGSGTVTSVGLSVPATSIFAATGTPVTSSGVLGLTTTGTSGGIPYFSSASQLATSTLLTAHGVVLGEGAGTAPVATSAGTSGQVLTSNGASADPTFQAAAGASSALNQITSGTTNTLASITTTFTTEVWLSASSGAKTDNVPGCVSGLNKDFLIEQDGQGTAGTNAITITPASGTIGPNGTASYVMAANGAATFFQCDGTSTTWRLVASNQPGSAVRYNTTTSLTVGANDNGNVISQSNASAWTASIAQANTTGFPEGGYYTIIQNTGAGTGTLSTTTSTFNGSGSTFSIAGGTPAAPVSELIFADLAGNWTVITLGGGSGGSSAFNAITSGTNTTAAMVVGSGSSLAVSGSGTIAATSAPASGLTGSTLASGVTGSSLTSVGTLTSLTVGGSAATTPNPLTMSASTVATNAALSNVFTGTMVHADSPYTFSNPTGLVAGQDITYVLAESSTGGDTVGTWGGNFAFPSGTPVFNPTAGAVNVVSCKATSSSALQCFGPSYPATNTQSGTTYTFAATDCGKTVIFTSNSAVTATIPASIVPASGTMCLIGVIQAGTAKDSVNGSAVSPATLISSHSYTGTSGTAGSTIALALTTISAATDAFLTGDGS